MTTLRIDIKGNPKSIPYRSFLDVGNNSLAILGDLDYAFSRRNTGAVDWYMSDLAINGLLRVEVYSQVRSVRRKLLEDVSGQIAGSFVKGFGMLEKEGRSPEYLSSYGMARAVKMTQVIGHSDTHAIIASVPEKEVAVEIKYPSLISSVTDFRFTNGTAQIDTHKKKVVSDEFGSGAAFLVARTLFQKTQFLDFQTAVAIGLVETGAPQSRQPDFCAWGPQSQNSIMLLEAKGTQTSLNYAASQIIDACGQLTQATVTATGYSQSRVAVAVALMRENSNDATTIYVGDPDPEPKYDFKPKDELGEIIRRSHYLRVALFTRDSELATYLASKIKGAPSQLEVREIRRKRYFGSSFVMRSESSTVTVFAGLDAEIRRALLGSGDHLPPSNEAISPRQHGARKRMTTIQNDGTCLDLSMEVNG